MVPGIVDEPTGVVRNAVNLGFVDIPLATLLAQELQAPVRVGHDVRAGGLAEAHLGAGRGHDDVLFVPLGTGIAAGCVVDGRLLRAGGYAGEIGHLIVVPDGEPCPCGQRGCLERYASAAAVARRYVDRTGLPAADGAAGVARLVVEGDTNAVAVWDEAVGTLADALVVAITLLGSAVVVIGGGLARAGETLLAPLNEALDGRVAFQRRPALVLARLGDAAGAIGAALLADQEGTVA